MSEEDQNRVADRERATRVLAGAEGAAAGGAVGAGIALASVLFSSAVGSAIPVVGTSIGALVGAAVASWIQSRRKPSQVSKSETAAQQGGATDD